MIHAAPGPGCGGPAGSRPGPSATGPPPRRRGGGKRRGAVDRIGHGRASNRRRGGEIGRNPRACASRARDRGTPRTGQRRSVCLAPSGAVIDPGAGSRVRIAGHGADRGPDPGERGPAVSDASGTFTTAWGRSDLLRPGGDGDATRRPGPSPPRPIIVIDAGSGTERTIADGLNCTSRLLAPAAAEAQVDRHGDPRRSRSCEQGGRAGAIRCSSSRSRCSARSVEIAQGDRPVLAERANSGPGRPKRRPSRRSSASPVAAREDASRRRAGQR